jgi:hypothetical protein
VHLRWNDAARDCHILFIAASEGSHLPQILERIAGAPVLTVADFESFARRGGEIELRRTGGRMRFDINTGAAAASGLRISSKVLALAGHVYTTDEMGEEIH